MENRQPYKQMQEVQAELSLFLKRARQREQEHYRLFDYTSKLLSKREQPEQTTIQNNQIPKLRAFFKQRLALDISHQEKDFALATKCESLSFWEENNLLARRVAARILEVTFNAIELRGQSSEYYSAAYSKFKEVCLKGLSQVKSKPAWIIRTTNRYLTQKIQVQLQRLRQTLNFLESNDFQKLSKVRDCYYSQLKLKEKQCTYAHTNYKQSLTHEIQKSPIKQQNDNSQKECKKQLLIRFKARSSKDEQNKSLKIKNTEAKKLKRLAASLSEVMDICRQEFLEQLAPQNKVWQTRRMLHDLVARNKNNQNYINTFRQRQWLFKQKMAKTPAFLTRGKIDINRNQSLEEQLLLNREKQQREVINAFTTKEIRISQPILNKKENPNPSRYGGARLVPKSGHIKKNNLRQRSTLNTIQESQKLNKQRQVFSSQKQILPKEQEFVQIHFKTPMPLPKARFPQINSRVLSLEKSQASKKQQLVRTKLEFKATSGNFFQEIQKRINKFCQMKRSLLA